MVPILTQPDESGERKVAAIIDIDCAVVNGFDEVDQKNLEELAELISRNCDW